MIHTIIVPTSILDACNQAALALGIDPEGNLSTFCVPLVPADGPDDAAPTHWAARGQIPDAAREYLADNLDQFPGAVWFRYLNGKLVASHGGEHIREPWGWTRSLVAAELKRQIKPFILP